MYNRFNIKELINFTKTLNVLYVEDNKEARESIILLLGNFFNNITTAINGEEALKIFNLNNFDLIISDIRMPVMSGIDMCKSIRKIEDYDKQNIPIIITTAHNESDILLECIKLDINGFLLKPINFKQLEKVIKHVCEKIYYKKKNSQYEQTLEQLVRDRTKELEIAKKELTNMANKDPLTNLYNRRYFTEISKTLIQIAKRDQENLSALMIDIDRFKNINDTYGHALGDKVIKKLANKLLEYTRDSDVVVRFGGEEFVILLPNTDINGAISIAKKIQSSVEKMEIKINDIENNILKFTVSIGISQCICNDEIIIDNIIRRTDEALYEAKRGGRNKVVAFEKRDIQLDN